MDILLILLLSVLASAIPVGVYSWFVWWLDRHEKEPWWLLALTFLWGAFGATTLSIIMSLILDIPVAAIFTGLAYELTGASVIAPIVEEINKALVLVFIFLFVRREVDSVLDGIVYGAMAGLGFAFIEDILYFLSSAEEGLDVLAFTVFFRSVVFGLNHAFYTGLTGMGLAYGRFSKSWGMRIFAPLAGLSASIFFHAVHNFGATLASVNCLSLLISLTFGYGGLFLMALAIVLVWRQERGWIETYLAPDNGRIFTAEQFQIIRSPLARWGHQWNLLFSGKGYLRRDWRKFSHAATELAFKRYQATLNPSDSKIGQTITQLEDEVLDLASKLI
jgi:RsiW-degrading membrane proteinase PrsW (M82 family)